MQRRLVISCLSAALAVACSKQSDAPPGPASQPATPPSTAVAPPATPAPPTATASANDLPAAPPASAESAEKPAPEACVKECVARNQMRAEAAEKIEADCRAECR